jgi:cobalamin biosynthesis protein CobD/CbiB
MNKKTLTLRKKLNVSLLVQLMATVILFIGMFFSYYILNDKVGFVIGVIIFVVDLILFAVFAKSHHPVYWIGILASFATGIIIGSYFSRFDFNYLFELILLGSTCVYLIIIHLLLRYFTYKKTFLVFLIFALFVLIIIGFISFKMIEFKSITFISIYIFGLMIALLTYLTKGRKLDRCLTGAMLWVFFVIFIIILIIISEGEILSGGFDAFDVGSGKKSKHKKIVTYK